MGAGELGPDDLSVLSGFGRRLLELGYSKAGKASGLGLRVEGSGLRVQGQGLGLRVLGFRVQG